MAINKRYSLINRLQAELPRGAPFDLTTLAAHYVQGDWLVRLAQGVYAFPNDAFDVSGALRFLQQRVAELHIGGRSGLTLQGVRHNLHQQETLVLWGDVRGALPNWFTVRFPARYVCARLFD